MIVTVPGERFAVRLNPREVAIWIFEINSRPDDDGIPAPDFTFNLTDTLFRDVDGATPVFFSEREDAFRIDAPVFVVRERPGRITRKHFLRIGPVVFPIFVGRIADAFR